MKTDNHTKKRIFFWAYIICAFNFTALIFYSFELLDPEGVIELFVFVAAVLAGSLVMDLYKYNKELGLRNQANAEQEV